MSFTRIPNYLYFATPDYAVAPTTITQDVPRAIISSYQPSFANGGYGLSLPEGRLLENMDWSNFVIRCHPRDKSATVLPVMDPAVRFAEACAKHEIGNIDDLLHMMETSSPKVMKDLLPQSHWLSRGKTILFRFPEHKVELFDTLKVEEVENLPAIPPVKLTDLQITRVYRLYNVDKSLYDGIVNPGQVYGAPVVEEIAVPSFVTRRQLHLALLGLFTPITEDMILQAINQLPEDIRNAATIEYQMATGYERSNPLINTLAAAFGLTTGDIDKLFIAAAIL